MNIDIDIGFDLSVVSTAPDRLALKSTGRAFSVQLDEALGIVLTGSPFQDDSAFIKAELEAQFAAGPVLLLLRTAQTNEAERIGVWLRLTPGDYTALSWRVAPTGTLSDAERDVFRRGFVDWADCRRYLDALVDLHGGYAGVEDTDFDPPPAEEPQG